MKGFVIMDQYKKMDSVPSAIEDFEGSMRAFQTAKMNASKEVWMPECKLWQ